MWMNNNMMGSMGGNQMMDPTMMNMNPMMMQMGGMNPMMMQMGGMNPMMMQMGGMNPMGMNNNFNMNMDMNMNMNIGDNQGWNLLFEEKNGESSITVTISPDKTVREAINLYKIKANKDANAQMKYIFNGKQLAYDLTLSQSGLQNNSKITVVSIQNVIGA